MTSRLWLCLHFPHLPLEVFSRAATGDGTPWVIVEGPAARRHVACCNEAALERGIRPGLLLSAAFTLTPALRVHGRDHEGERRALETLADWAGQFTSFVALRPPQSLLLEIGGSLRLFTGIEALRREIHGQLAPLGYRCATGIAPTPRGAALLARAGNDTPAPDLATLRAALRPLPLDLLEIDAKQRRSLAGMGLVRLGELLRLPRAGLARRLGQKLVDELARLLGERADPVEPYRAPDRFDQCLILPVETTDMEALLFPAHRLLLELEAFLQRRDAGTLRLDWILLHERRPSTTFALGLAAPRRDAGHLLALLREHLARLEPDHPVTAIGLRVETIESLPKASESLLDDPCASGAREDGPQLLDRLRARLGDGAVQGLCCLTDHRPERAWQPCAPGKDDPVAPAPGRRPLWLLPEPLALSAGSAPLLSPEEAPLALIEGPERIESGWWDGHDAARDYYVACDTSQAKYWIFRERRPDPRGERRWFLHGYFA